MKKLLSVMLALCMLFSISAGIDFSAQAATKYSNSVINSNIKKIRKHIEKNGYINNNYDYTIKDVSYYDGYTYYALMLIDSTTDKLEFYMLVEEDSTEEVISSVSVDVVDASDKSYYVESSYWLYGSDYSDIDGFAYIDKSFDPDNYYAGFEISYNGTGASNNTAIQLFEAQLAVAFDKWDNMLKKELKLNMGAVGFHSRCEDHNYKTKTTAATTSKDGKKVKTCKICGKIASTKVIPKASKVKLDTKSFVYDGSAKKPKVIVKDRKGNTISSDNYTVSYSKGRKDIGEYKVTVKFKGNYSGTKKLYFTVTPKPTTVSSVKGASKGVNVKWKKQTKQTSGYEIQCATDSSFKNNVKTTDVSKNSTTSKKITGLKSKKKYYVRVRTYKKVNSKKIYSPWSEAKSATTK